MIYKEKLKPQDNTSPHMLKDEVSENTLKKRREYYLKHGVKNVFPSGLLESSSLNITTPYMLRNDGGLLECGEYHPYIKSYRKESLEETIKYLKNHNSFLKWFYENTLNEEVKNIISNLKFTQEEIDRLWYLTNQEFCRVRTSNYRYKIGGDNGEIYFRISSENFDWFELIWNVCVKFIHSIDYVTIMKDPQTFGKQFDYIKIKDTKINKLPIKDFIELDGEPLVESQVIKEPSFEHNYHYKRVWATNSSSEMASAIMNSTIALRILYDTKHKFYVYSDAEGYIHRDLLEIAWEYGMYPEYTQRWQFQEGHFEDHTYQLLYTPKDKVDSTWGANIKQDDYTDRIEYSFGVITGRNDYQDVFLNKIPLIKTLKKYELKHTYFDGWENDGYTPKIKVLSDNTNNVSDNLTEDTIKLKNGKWANVGKDGKRDSGTFKTKKKADAQRKAMFANGFKESLDTNNTISLLSNTFGTTDEPQPTAMYILPNGRFLFTTPLEPSDDCDYEIDEHRNIDDFLYHKDIIEDDRYLEDDGSLFTENVLNCIRFNITDEYYGNYSYIQLNKKQPTSQQYDSLLKIFDYVLNHRYKYLSIILDNQYGKQIKIELNNYTSDELIKKIKRYYVSRILTEGSKNKQLTLQDIFPYTNKKEETQDKTFYLLDDSDELWEIVKYFGNDLVLIISGSGKKDVAYEKSLIPAPNSLQNDEKEVIIKENLFDFIDNCLKELYEIKQSNPEEVDFLKLAFSELEEAKIPVGYRYAKVEKNKMYCFRKPRGSGGALRVFFFIKNDKVVCFKAWLKGSKTEENKIIQDGVKKYLNYN